MTQQVVVYGAPGRLHVYTTAYDREDLALAIGYCQRAHPDDVVWLLEASRVPIALLAPL